MIKTWYVILIISLGFGLSFGSVALSQDRKISAPQARKNNEQQIEKTRKIKQKPSVPFVIGAELRNYTYSEPGFVNHAGLLYGAWAEWGWVSDFGKFKFDGNFLYGNLDYDGALCDLSSNCTPYKSTTTDVITKVNAKMEWSVSDSAALFAGLGYRYLYDRGNGTGFYTRTGHWFYIPIGLQFKANQFSFTAEYDTVVYGNFTSNLSEVSSSFTDITHAQRGYGLLLSTGYYINESWTVSLLYESWNLDESDPVVSGSASFVEPKNNAQSIALRVGFNL